LKVSALKSKAGKHLTEEFQRLELPGGRTILQTLREVNICKASYVLCPTSIAALPPSVRKGYAFPLLPFIFRGCASGDVEAQPQEFCN